MKCPLAYAPSYDEQRDEFVVTAEYFDGFKEVSRHKSLLEAMRAIKRYKAADLKRRKA